MAKWDMKGFLTQVEKGMRRTKFSDWKKDGKTIGWIHPNIGIYQRMRHGGFPKRVEDDDGKIEVRLAFFNCAGPDCPLCKLKIFAGEKIQGDFDPDMRILNGGKKQSATLNDLSGAGSWKKNVDARPSYMIPWIPKKWKKGEPKIEVLNVPDGLAFAIKRVIDSQMEELGETKGDPMLNPYPLKLMYDDDQMPARKYSAERVTDDVAPMKKRVKKTMAMSEEELDLDLESLTKPDRSEEIMKALESSWSSSEIPFEEFEDYCGGVSKEVDEDEDYDEATGTAEDDDDEDDGSVDDDDGDGEEDDEDGDEYDPSEDDNGDYYDEKEDEDDEVEDEEDEEEEPPRKPKATKKTSKKTSKKTGKKTTKKTSKKTGKKTTKKTSKKTSKKKVVTCPDCDERVRPNKYGKCPACAAELDIDY